jgi:hypothetical protein
LKKSALSSRTKKFLTSHASSSRTKMTPRIEFAAGRRQFPKNPGDRLPVLARAAICGILERRRRAEALLRSN